VPADLFRLRARALAKGRKALREKDPEGVHDLRVALRRLGATAGALGEREVERGARSLVRVFSPLRQLEVDRQMLARLRSQGLLSEEAATGLDARLDGLYAAGLKKAVAKAQGLKMRRLVRRLDALVGKPASDAPRRLERARRRLENRLVPPDESSSDRQLHRFRIAVKQARYLAEDLAACGVQGLEAAIDREKDLQDALGHWNDVRLLRERLLEIRSDAEERGAVTLAQELDRLIPALEESVASTRRQALAGAGRLAKVLSFLERSA
jgi:CHAD domain-containing protein